MTENIQKNNQIVFSKKIKSIEKYNFYEYISIMLDAWVGMSESLNSVTEKLDNIYFKQEINDLIVFVSSWDSLSRAMKKKPLIFWSHEISIIEAWEATGTLWKSLLIIANNIKKNDELAKKVKASLTYPLIIFLFLIIAVVIVLTYVIPSLLPLFENSETELPMATVALINTSNFVKYNFYYIIFFFFVSFVALYWFKNTPNWKERLDQFLLQMPLIWKVYRNYVLTNISLTIWNLIWAWIPTLKVLRLVWRSSWSIVYEKIFDLVLKRVELWEKIVDSMRLVDPDKKYFPNTFLQMLQVWEKTANIESISKKIHAQYEREVDYSLINLTKWIEPIAILFAAWFVLWFAFAIFWAILKVTQTVA